MAEPIDPDLLAASMRALAPLETNMTNDRMALWNEAFVTDPKAVKPITGKQYKGNSPKPYWLIQRATEVFGPVGIGWGVVVKSERFERLGEFDVLHVAVVSVWYVLNGKRSDTFDQMGGTKAAYMTSKGALMVDEDAGKKSVTDGMVKCLSMIGFAGDIFSGMWDDSKYVDWATQETERRERDSDPAVKHAAAMEDLAAVIADAFRGGREMDGFGLYEPLEQEDRLLVWNSLKRLGGPETKGHSRIRSRLKEMGDEVKERQAKLDAMPDGSDPALLAQLQASIDAKKAQKAAT